MNVVVHLLPLRCPELEQMEVFGREGVPDHRVIAMDLMCTVRINNPIGMGGHLVNF